MFYRVLLLLIAYGSAKRLQALEASHMELCDPGIVEDTCNNILDKDRDGWSSMEDLARVLSTTPKEALLFLEQLWGEKPSKFSCKELCGRSVESVSAEFLPPIPDVGCRRGGNGEVICDVDLSGKQLAAIDFPAEARDVHEGHDGEEALSTAAEEDDRVEEERLRVSWGVPEMKVKVLNLFRIYPILDSVVSDAEEEPGNGTETSALEVRSQSKPLCLRAHCDGKLPELCRLSNICGACKGCRGVRVQKNIVMRNFDRAMNKIVGGPAGKKTDIPESEQLDIYNQYAQAMIATAIREFDLAHTSAALQRWFGEDSAHVRKIVRGILNSADKVLSNVEYKRPSLGCGEHTTAWVAAAESKNWQNQNLIFICDHFFRFPPGDKMATLVHEASHHAVANLHDSCMPGKGHTNYGVVALWKQCGQTAYGKQNCLELARQRPKRALKNADSFAYFVSDMSKNFLQRHGMAGPH